MKLVDAHIVWNGADHSGGPAVNVGYLDDNLLGFGFANEAGANEADWRDMSHQDRWARLLRIWVAVHFQSNVPLGRVHYAFLEIDEYRTSKTPRMPGADHPVARFSEEFLRAWPM